jgi:ABC-type multidrug transport system ATPase subunit
VTDQASSTNQWGETIEPLTHGIASEGTGLGATKMRGSSQARRRALTVNQARIVQTDEDGVATLPDRVTLDHDLTVGRQAIPGQVVLDHPNVSRRHAAFEVVDGTIVLRDLGGTNGTYLNGERLRGTRPLIQGDRIDIGPFQLTFDGAALTRAGRVGNVELMVRGVSYDVSRSGVPRRILHGANLRILPSEFVAIIGANGSGKSTLMNIIAGRALPSEGIVQLNGRDLHANFQALKQDIAYVPQQDVLHEQLTLRQALDYTAQLRLPPDTTVEQRHLAVNEAARSVDLLDQLDQRIGALSGGQKKCASLASEILNRPSLLLLDEVTSGLDESADWEIMRLLRRLADEGVTIIVVTHTLANVAEFCDKVMCMGRGGQPTFIGAPSEVLEFFVVRRLGEVFERSDELGAESWRARFEATVSATINLPPTVESRDNTRRPALQHPREPVILALPRVTRQAAILLHRNTTLLLSDRRTLAMAAVQSVFIGVLMGYAFGDFGTGQERINAENALLLLLGLSAIWLGCNAASKDIVGELAIYRRETDINLSTAAFIGAKYLVSCAFTVLQLAVVYILVSAFADGIPGDRLQQFTLLTLGAMAGTAMGLVISAFANTRDQATTIVPLALVPQLILAGVLVPKLPDLARAVAKIAVSGYWLTEAMKSVFITAEGPIQTMNAHTGTLMDMTAVPAALGATIVAAHALAFLLIAYLVTLLRHGRRRRSV